MIAVCFNTGYISVNKVMTRCRVLVMMNMVVQVLNTTLWKAKLPVEF